MIKYICHNCNDHECETSVCPICGKRADLLESVVFWCEHCNAPSFYEICPCCGETCKYIGTDLRPVFPQERLLLEILEGEPFRYSNSAIWNVGSNHYIIDGKKKNITVIRSMLSMPVQFSTRKMIMFRRGNCGVNSQTKNLHRFGISIARFSIVVRI